MSTTTPVDYSKRIFFLIVGLLIAGAVAAVIYFGSVRPAQRERERIERNTEEVSDAISCNLGLGRC